MNETNIVIARFTYGNSTKTKGIFQWDHGMILKFEGIELPTTYTVHFANQLMSGNAKTQVGNADGVEIYDEYLTTGLPVYAWVYLHTGESDGETVYSVMIPVTARPRPVEDAPTPVQQGAIDTAIAALNAGVATVEGIAEAIPQTIDAALTEAKESGEFDGPPGRDGTDGLDGRDGTNGVDGYSPTAVVTQTSGGATISITDKSGTTTGSISNGKDGADGKDGQDGAPGVGVPSGGTQGQVLKKKSGTDYDTEWGNEPSAPVTDVQVDGTSILNNGVANVPVADLNTFGTVKVSTVVRFDSSNRLVLTGATDAQIKNENTSFPLLAAKAPSATFYGLAKAAGDTTQSQSSNVVGQYTDSAKSAISQMLNSPVTIAGSTPTITALPGVRYICGECATLDITLPASGCVDVVFESGSTPTVLTITPPTGVTVKWANGFDPTALDADTTYEINIADGLGVAASWT